MPEIRDYVQFDTLEATDALVVDRLGVGTGYVETSLVTNLTPTGVIAGSYLNTNLTVNEFGQITTATNGSSTEGGTVTTTGAPVAGNLTQFSGPTSITNGNLSGDVTTNGTLVTTIERIQGTTVSGTTGSGNVVFSSAPTLTLINATLLPIVGGTTGTLTVPRGGTGDTTLTAHGVMIGQGTSAVAVTAAGTAGQVLTSNGASADPTFQDASGITAADIDRMYFGDGHDGDLTISSGTTRITRDMYYRNLTISGTGRLINNDAGNTNAYRIFVSGILDISAAPATAITALVGSGGDGLNGGGGATSTLRTSTGTVGQAGAIATGGASGISNSAGVQATDVGTTEGVGGPAGASGAGGAGTSAGGVSRPATAVTLSTDVRTLMQALAVPSFDGSYILPAGGAGGPGGASGGGDATPAAGGGGGAGGNGGGVLYIAARTINRGASTASAAITVKGGNGGAGSVNTVGTDIGGGGGGAGAGGGWLYLIVRTLTGATAANCLDATGGNGGAGANGRGTGLGGAGGAPGGGGRIDVYNLGAGTQTILETTVAGVGNPAVGSGGGPAANATAQMASL